MLMFAQLSRIITTSISIIVGSRSFDKKRGEGGAHFRFWKGLLTRVGNLKAVKPVSRRLVWQRCSVAEVADTR